MKLIYAAAVLILISGCTPYERHLLLNLHHGEEMIEFADNYRERKHLFWIFMRESNVHGAKILIKKFQQCELKKLYDDVETEHDPRNIKEIIVGEMKSFDDVMYCIEKERRKGARGIPFEKVLLARSRQFIPNADAFIALLKNDPTQYELKIYLSLVDEQLLGNVLCHSEFDKSCAQAYAERFVRKIDSGKIMLNVAKRGCDDFVMEEIARWIPQNQIDDFAKLPLSDEILNIVLRRCDNEKALQILSQRDKKRASKIKAFDLDAFKTLVAQGQYQKAAQMLEGVSDIQTFFNLQKSILGIKTDKYLENALLKKFSEIKKIESERICRILKRAGNLDSLNTHEDYYNNTLEKGYIYNYTGYGNCYFKVMQVINERQILVSRDWPLLDAHLVDAYRPVTLSVLHSKGKKYITGQRLSPGDYVCYGTLTYKTVTGRSNTIYHLLDMESFRDVAWYAYYCQWEPPIGKAKQSK